MQKLKHDKKNAAKQKCPQHHEFIPDEIYFDNFVEREPNDARGQEGNKQFFQNFYAEEASPVQHDNRKYRAELDYDFKTFKKVCLCKVEKGTSQNEVARGGNRQELCYALNHT